MEPDPIAALLRVSKIFDQLGIVYCIGGSVASSYYGIPRTTNDIDVVADIRPDQIDPLVAACEAGYMIDRQAVERAVAHRRSFNIIDFETLEKIDIFTGTDRTWTAEELRRRRATDLGQSSNTGIVFLVSPEDAILSKLIWYHQGDEVSERQWQDTISMLTVQGETLAWDYLREWAGRLGVLQLLDRALRVTGRDWQDIQDG